jgi:hypothetical protein
MMGNFVLLVLAVIHLIGACVSVLDTELVGSVRLGRALYFIGGALLLIGVMIMGRK